MLTFAGVPKDLLPALPKFEKALPTVYTPEQIKGIRKVADDYMTLVIDLGLMCGLREQEMQFLIWPDLDLTGKVLRVTGKPELGFLVKDSEQREVPIPDELATALEARKKVSKGRLVLGVGKDQKNPNTHLLRQLKRLAKRAELTCGACGCEESGECKEWTLHKLRRTYATTLLRNQVDLRTVQSLMGHSDLESTLRYLRPASGNGLQAAVNAIAWAG